MKYYVDRGQRVSSSTAHENLRDFKFRALMHMGANYWPYLKINLGKKNTIQMICTHSYTIKLGHGNL